MPRTRLSVCNRKSRFKTEPEAALIAALGRVPLRTYRCDRCRQFHLTSRTKGKRVPRTGYCGTEFRQAGDDGDSDLSGTQIS